MTINFHSSAKFVISARDKYWYLDKLSCAGICKNCAMVACRRDYFLAKVSRLVSADGATNVYSLNRRAVSGHISTSPTHLGQVRNSLTNPASLSGLIIIANFSAARQLLHSIRTYNLANFYTKTDLTYNENTPANLKA